MAVMLDSDMVSSFVEKGFLSLFEWALDLHFDKSSLLAQNRESDYVIYAACNGHFDMVKRLAEIGFCLPNSVFLWAADCGKVDFFEWYFANETFLTERGKAMDAPSYSPEQILRNAVSGGHLEMVRYLLKKSDGHHDPDEDGYLWFAAACSGNVEVAQLIIDLVGFPTEPDICTGMLEAAAEKGNVEVFNLLYERGCPTGSHLFERAARGGSIVMLKRLLEFLLPDKLRSEAIISGAAESLRLDVLEFVFEEKIVALGEASINLEEIADRVVSAASFVTSESWERAIPILQYLIRLGVTFGESFVLSIIDLGAPIEVLRWAAVEGHVTTFSEFSARNVLDRGSLDNLIFVMERCSEPFTMEVFRIAAERGRVDVLEWAMKMHFMHFDRTCLLMAAISLSQRTLRWAVRRGYHLADEGVTVRCIKAASLCPHGPTTVPLRAKMVIQLILRLGGYLTEDAFAVAAKVGNVALMDYLACEGCPINVELIRAAIGAEPFEEMHAQLIDVHKVVLNWLRLKGYSNDEAVKKWGAELSAYLEMEAAVEQAC